MDLDNPSPPTVRHGRVVDFVFFSCTLFLKAKFKIPICLLNSTSETFFEKAI